MKAVDAMSAPPPAGYRTGANRWERGTLWLQHVDPPPAVEGPWPPLASDPDAFTTFARDLGADARYRFIDVLDIDAPPKRALAFVVCYPTGGSVAEAILPLFSTPPPPNAAFFARQTVGGTCGTVALLNALLNAPGVALPELGIEGDRPTAAAVLAAPAVRAAHDRAAGAAGSAEAGRRQGRHFVALVKVAKDYLWLDGKRSGPVGAGPRSKKGAKRELRKLVDAVLDARPDALFSVVALVDTAPRPRPRTARGGAAGAAAPVPPPPLATRLSLRRTRSGESSTDRPRRSKMYRK